MKKYSGQTKKKQDERETKKKNGVSALISGIAGQTQKFANEWTEKHNSLANHVNVVFNTIKLEIQKVWQNQQAFAESLEHVDFNVLAFAEVLKDVYNRLASNAIMLKKLEEMTEQQLLEGMEEELKKAGEELHAAQIKAAFSTVLEKRKQEEEARKQEEEVRKAAVEKARAEAEVAEAAKTEADIANRALSEAENEKLEDVSNTGGKGQDIPEGAQVFGG